MKINMKHLVDYIVESKDRYKEYLDKLMKIDDKYDHEQGSFEANQKNNEEWDAALKALDDEYPEEAEQYYANGGTRGYRSGEVMKRYNANHKPVKKQPKEELPEMDPETEKAYMLELQAIDDKYDHEFGSREENEKNDKAWDEAVRALKKKYKLI